MKVICSGAAIICYYESVGILGKANNMVVEKQKTNAGAANGASASAGAQAANQPRRKGDPVIVLDDKLRQDMKQLRALLEETQRLVGILYEREFGVKFKKSS